MRIEIKKDLLKQVVGQAERVTSKNLTLPILNSILLETEENRLTIKATNLEIGLEIEIPVKVEKSGQVAVSAQLLGNFLNNISQEEKINLKEDNGNLIIQTQSSETTIKCQSTEDFPIIPRVTDGGVIEIEANDFVSGLKSVLFSASLSDIKPEISSVYLYTDNDKIIFVSTDSFRLAEKKIEQKDVLETQSLIIPYKNITEMIRVFESVTGKIKIVSDKNQMSVFNNSIHFTSRIIDGVYPDYRQIIPKSQKTEVVLNKSDLFNALKLANIFADKFNQIDLKINPNEGKITIHSLNQDLGENKVELKAKITGEEMFLSVNAKYFLDCFNSLNGEEITISFTEKNRPIILKTNQDKSFTYLVMPINR